MPSTPYRRQRAAYYERANDPTATWGQVADRSGYANGSRARQSAIAFANRYGHDLAALRLGGPRPGRLPSTPTFGIEIEVNSLRPEDATRALQRAGIVPVVFRGYGDHAHGRRRPPAGTWVVTTDCTVTGCEVVTPDGGLPYTDESFDQIRRVMQVLRDNGAHVNLTGGGSPGCHTHIGTRGMTRQQVVDFGRAYVARQGAINGLVARRRRHDSGMCQTMDLAAYDRYAEPVADGRHAHGRYVAVNLCSYAKHGTVEFRQHQGTLNATKIRAWVDMLMALRAAVLDGSIANVGTGTEFLADLAAAGHLNDTAASYLAARLAA